VFDLSRRAPGLYLEEPRPTPGPGRLLTGVPVFLGYAEPLAAGPLARAPRRITSPAELAAAFRAGHEQGYLGDSVEAFFANGGEQCWVVSLDRGAGAYAALLDGLDRAGELEDADLVCAPDVMRPRPSADAEGNPVAAAPDPDEVAAMQGALLTHCERAGTRIAILDALPHPAPGALVRQAARLGGAHGALYHPWVALATDRAERFVPPCGAVAGVVARTDRQTGVHKAPANASLEGVADVEPPAGELGELNAAGVNCILALPGRGIRVWGARTTSGDPRWTYLNVRRVVLTVARWIERSTRDVAFEPNGPATWARVTRSVDEYLGDIYRGGALLGATPEDAFEVRCDATNNPAAVRDAGRLVVEVALAPAVPAEFVLVRLVRSAGSVTIDTAAPAV
jgi:hypothetical protein